MLLRTFLGHTLKFKTQERRAPLVHGEIVTNKGEGKSVHRPKHRSVEGIDGYSQGKVRHHVDRGSSIFLLQILLKICSHSSQ